MGIIRLYISTLQLLRALEILGVLIRYSCREMLSSTFRFARRRKAHKRVYTTPERIRMTIEEMGPTFVKFGQILADRPDMVSERFASELKKLQSRAQPFSSQHAVALIEDELNASIEEVFATFDRVPLAAASIGQVYQATLQGGEPVVVKIQRPYIENRIKLDIYLLKFLARRFARSYPELAAINIVGLIDEFSQSIIGELDYTVELGNMRRFMRMFSGDETVHIPRFYESYCSKKLLVMERVEGLTPDSAERMREAGLDTRIVAENGANALLKMILRYGFFHADPHPGNLFILPSGAVAFIDFGMVGQLSPREMDFLADFAIGYVRQDAALIARALVTLCGRRFFEQQEELQFDVEQLLRQVDGVEIEKIDFAKMMQCCVELIVKYRLQIPSGIFMLIKAMATLEKFATSLAPELSVSEMIMPYAQEVVERKYAPKKVATELYDTLINYLNFVRSFPSDMSEILYKLKEGKIKHDIKLSDQAIFVRTMRQVTRRIAYVLLLIGIFIGSVLLIEFRAPSSRYGHLLFVVSSLLILFQFMAWLFNPKSRKQ